MTFEHPARPRVIPIQAQAAQQLTVTSCADCLPSATGPVCRDELGPRCEHPSLSGPPERLAWVLARLEAALAVQVPGGLLASGLLHSLTLGPDEATLVLAVAPRCGGALLADAAFQVLRQALPDADVYVLHAR